MASKLNLKPLCGANITVNKKKSGHNGDLTGLQNYFPIVFHCDSQLRVLENKKFLKEIIVFPIFDIFFFNQHPYPTEDEKRAIAAQTNLTILQVNNW